MGDSEFRKLHNLAIKNSLKNKAMEELIKRAPESIKRDLNMVHSRMIEKQMIEASEVKDG